MTDIEIAENAKMKSIVEIAGKLGLGEDDLILYGKYKAKVDKKVDGKEKGKLILVTAISPTKSGNGKTTVSIGLADAMAREGRKVCLALREPSLGPVFGIKGGATGGGLSQILPMADINLHFNGDFHAITSANNLLASIIDNHIFQGNELGIEKVLFKRCIDLNDRALRDCEVGKTKGCMARQEHFTITSASEVMAIMCLSRDLKDLKERLGNIIVGIGHDKKVIYAKDLKAENAMAILLKDALKPNLVQTIEGTPALVHCGPFANIAHGCNSIIATEMALSLADYCVTEAGFGADLGGEKFVDIKCRLGGMKPKCVVLVATIRALKLNGGESEENLSMENIIALEKGMKNLERHLKAIKEVYHLACVVTLNRFESDSAKEMDFAKQYVKRLGAKLILNEVWAKGGKGGEELARAVIEECEKTNEDFSFAYQLEESVKDKIFAIASKIYGASGVNYSLKAEESIKEIDELGYSNLPIVMAKTQFSFSDDPKLLGAPENFEINVDDIEIKAGAGFLVVIVGKMMLMPGLSKSPVALSMNIDENGKIEGLF